MYLQAKFNNNNDNIRNNDRSPPYHIDYPQPKETSPLYQPRSHHQKRKYNRYKNNRVNGIFQMSYSEIEGPAVANNTIGIVEVSSSGAKQTFGEEGTCYFVVANAPQQQTRVISPYTEGKNTRLTPTLTTSYPGHLKRTNFGHIHVETHELSISSGVGSGESSELDSPNPLNMSERSLYVTSCHETQKRSSYIYNCSCASPNSQQFYTTRTRLNTSSSTATRDSGICSISSPGLTSPDLISSLHSTHHPHYPLPCPEPCSHSQCQNKEHAKELLLLNIKRGLHDSKKEDVMEDLKTLLRHSGYETFKEQSTHFDWTPLSREKLPMKGVLKKPKMSLLEEIQARHAARDVANAKQETRLVCPLRRSEIVKIIQQVRHCLRYTKAQFEKPFQYQFQVHRKIRLKTFPPFTDDGEANVIEQQQVVNFHCKQIKMAAGKGNVKKVLNLLNSNQCTHSQEACSDEWSAFHTAFQKKHFRTAILLLEAGTDLKEYTELRVKDYNDMMDVVSRNANNYKL